MNCKQTTGWSQVAFRNSTCHAHQARKIPPITMPLVGAHKSTRNLAGLDDLDHCSLHLRCVISSITKAVVKRNYLGQEEVSQPRNSLMGQGDQYFHIIDGEKA